MEIETHVDQWKNDPKIAVIILDGTGDRAFCAGGDIRALHDWGKSNDDEATGFYKEEYLLNRYIKRYPKPYVSFVNGIVMGGGVGLSVHASHRIAGENYSFAMPETGIGLFPDVGGTFFLPRLKYQAGIYLALTGSRIKAADAIFLETATHYINSDNFNKVIERLSQGLDADQAIEEFSSKPGESEFKKISSLSVK